MKIKNADAFIYIIPILSLIVYANSLWNGFVWDDHLFIEQSDFIKDGVNIFKMFTPDYLYLSWKNLDVNRPLMVVSLVADYHIWGLNPFGYHLTNVVLHANNSVLLYTLLRLVSIDKTPAGLGTLLFVLHPIQTETVNGINFREDLLATFFFLLAIVYFIKTALNPHLKTYIISMVAFVMALLSKETAVAFLPIALVYLYSFKKRIDIRYNIGYLLILSVYLIFLMAVYYNSDIPSKVDIKDGWPIFPITTWGIAYYIKMVLLPINLNIDHTPITVGLNDIIALGFLISFLYLFLFALRYNKATIFLGSCFLITLLPSIPVIYSYNTIMERFLYLPMAGFCGIMGIIVGRFTAKKGRYILILLLIIFSSITIDRNMVWKNDYSLWTDATRKAPQSSIAHINLGSALLAKKDYKGAFSEFLESLKINPDKPEAYYKIGFIHSEEKRYDLAIQYLEAAANKDNSFALPDIYDRLGYAYAMKGKYKEAIKGWLIYIKLDKESAETFTNLGSAYAKLGLREKAIETYQKALKIDPNYSDAIKYLAKIS